MQPLQFIWDFLCGGSANQKHALCLNTFIYASTKLNVDLCAFVSENENEAFLFVAKFTNSF